MRTLTRSVVDTSDEYLVRSATRLLSKVSETHRGCWLRAGAGTPAGYAVFWFQGRQTYAHRASYEMFVGPIPDGLVIDHLCRNRRCVNPEHLEAVTQQENLLRGSTHPARNAAKTHCVNGHEFTPANTYRYANGARYCRPCGAERARNKREGK